jgi:hypothetical protein
MRTLRILRCCFLTSIFVALAGCGQKLDYETAVQLEAGDVQLLAIDPPKREQKVTVTVTSSGSPISVYVILGKDKEAAKQALLDSKKPTGALASNVKTQEATLEATIPANTGFGVLLGGASKSSQVKVKVTGR